MSVAMSSRFTAKLAPSSRQLRTPSDLPKLATGAMDFRPPPKPLSGYVPLNGAENLPSSWDKSVDLTGYSFPVRLEGEIGDLIVRGCIPPRIDGTFYRVSQDTFTPPHPQQVPIEGHGAVSAFRIRNGRVDFKVRYVQTERYKLERRAGKTLFGLYKNPWADHPCVRGAVDSTANTNIVYWAKHLLALRESANAYSMDPDTLETTGYDPFGDQIKAAAFTAHPKVDPFTNELIVFGYEAKGPGTPDVVNYSIDRTGNVKNELWVKSPHTTFIHDMALTENWVVLLLWPFEADVARMKQGGQHFAYNYDLPSSFIIVPRRPDRSVTGWRPGEYRVYNWKNCMNIHTAGAWEEDDKIYMECARVHDNAFPFFPAADGRRPNPETVADFVRYKFDLTKQSESHLPDPRVVLDMPCEFPRIDDRLLSRQYEVIFLNVFLPGKSDTKANIFAGLNAVGMINTRTGDKQFYYPGDNCYCQEPIFIPRTDESPEGDGYIMFVVERRDRNTNSLVFLDTRDFQTPIAIAELPMRLRSQIHGNWVDSKDLNEKPLVYYPEEDIQWIGKGWDPYTQPVPWYLQS